MTHYPDEFYQARHKQTVYAAETITGLVLRHIPVPRSAVDLGCGVGTWLWALKKQGTAEVAGVDGPWVNRAHLMIPQECFTASDFSAPFSSPHRYDLAISLEVAEHLPESKAPQFVGTLCGLSDMVLFSAAMPFQKGRGHLNEQWPQYWASLFRTHGYGCLDLVRLKIWQDDNIALWYRQNLMLYVKREKLPLVSGASDAVARAFEPPLGLVHPTMYLRDATVSIRNGFRVFSDAVVHSLRRRLGLPH